MKGLVMLMSFGQNNWRRGEEITENRLGSGTSEGCDGERAGWQDSRIWALCSSASPSGKVLMGSKASENSTICGGFVKMVAAAFLLKFLTWGWRIKISAFFDFPWPCCHCHRCLTSYCSHFLVLGIYHFLCILNFFTHFSLHSLYRNIAHGLTFCGCSRNVVGVIWQRHLICLYLWHVAHDQYMLIGMEWGVCGQKESFDA